jgi:hypothetical protein
LLKLSDNFKIKRIEYLMNEWYSSTLTQDNLHLLSWLEDTYLPIENKKAITDLLQNNIKLVKVHLSFTSYSIEGWN